MQNTLLPRFLLAPLAALACALPVLARQEAAVGQALPEARAILDRFAEVTHAAKVVPATRSLHATGSFSMAAMGLSGAADIWSAKPNLRAVSMDMGGFGTMKTGFDGKTAWMTHPMMGARILTGTERLQAMLEAAYDGGLKPSSLYESTKTIGRETFEGKDCYAVQLVAKALPGMDAEQTLAARTSIEYYDIASGFQIGTSGRQEGELGGGPYTTVLSDYKDFGGQLLATRTRVRQSGVEIELTVTKVEYDTATEATFLPPAEIRALTEAPAAEPK